MANDMERRRWRERAGDDDRRRAGDYGQGRNWSERDPWGEREGRGWEQSSWRDADRDLARGMGGETSRSERDGRHDRDYGGSLRRGGHGGEMGEQGSYWSGSRDGAAGAHRGGVRRSLEGDYGYGARREWEERNRDERGFWDKASDEVSSWFGDEEASRRREQDHRHAGLGPRNYARSDSRINEDICDRLTDHPFIDASDIEVSVSGREVTLSGTVQSREEKRRAEDIAEAVSGVTHVQNNLRVKQHSVATSGGAGASALDASSSATTKTTTGSSPGIMKSDPSSPSGSR